MPLESYKAKIIGGLVEKGVVLIGSYPLKSKRVSPYFLKLDAVNDGEGLEMLSGVYADAIKRNFPSDSYDVIVGIPEKAHVFGPPVVVALAKMGVNKKYSSWRAIPKKRGDAAGGAVDEYAQVQAENLLGSAIPRGSRILLVDDVVTAGDSKREAITKLDVVANGCSISGIVIIGDRQELNDYGDPALDEFAKTLGMPVVGAITASDIFDYLKDSDKLLPVDEARFLDYFRAWGTADIRQKYGLENKPLIEGRSVIPACDLDSLERFEDVVRETAEVPGIGGYKIGFELTMRYGLPRVVEVAKKHVSRPIIYDHQKAATDIGDPEFGRKFARAAKESGVDAVIFFPQAGPVTQTVWTGEALQAGIGVIVGGHMTHKGYLSKDGGYIRDDAPQEIYKRAARHGVTNFVVPGNNPDAVRAYRELLEGLGVQPVLFAPGFVTQDGDISETGKAAGERFHAIVGRDLINVKDIQLKAEKLTSQLLNNPVDRTFSEIRKKL